MTSMISDIGPWSKNPFPNTPKTLHRADLPQPNRQSSAPHYGAKTVGEIPSTRMEKKPAAVNLRPDTIDW